MKVCIAVCWAFVFCYWLMNLWTVQDLELTKRELQAARLELKALREQNDYKDRLIAVSGIRSICCMYCVVTWYSQYWYLNVWKYCILRHMRLSLCSVLLCFQPSPRHNFIFCWTIGGLCYHQWFCNKFCFSIVLFKKKKSEWKLSQGQKVGGSRSFHNVARSAEASLVDWSCDNLFILAPADSLWKSCWIGFVCFLVH